MKTFTTVALAAALMAGSSAPVLAQGYNTAQGQYQSNQGQYQRDQQAYDSSYRAYQTAREQYERDKAAYDRQYGAGAYDRYYSQGSWNGDRWDNRQYGDNNTTPRYNPYDRYRDTPCERAASTNSRDRTTGTVLGALIGGALGATAAGRNSQTEGAVLGAVVGGALGNQIAANSSDADRYAAKCDNVGYYYTYDQTQPYREDTVGRGQRNGRYDNSYYTRQRCRLAVAPAQYGDRTDYRYVRVCPDRNNRYRITN